MSQAKDLDILAKHVISIYDLNFMVGGGGLGGGAEGDKAGNQNRCLKQKYELNESVFYLENKDCIVTVTQFKII